MTLKSLRKQNNLSQEELAEILDVSVWTVRSYEQGIRKPSIQIAKKLRDLYGLTAEQMLEVCFESQSA